MHCTDIGQFAMENKASLTISHSLNDHGDMELKDDRKDLERNRICNSQRRC